MCSQFAEVSLIPVALWLDGSRLCGSGFVSGVEPDRHVFPELVARLGGEGHETTSLGAEGGSMYAASASQGGRRILVMGPVFPSGTSKTGLDAISHAMGTPAHLWGDVRTNLTLIPQPAADQLMSTCQLFHSLVEVALRDDESGKVDWYFARTAHERAARRQDIPDQQIHEFMQAVDEAIRLGDYDRLVQTLDLGELATIVPNIHGDAELRHAKGILGIVLAEAAEHGAVPGGLSLAEAYALVDAYLWQADRLTSGAEVRRLLRTALVDLAGLVAERHIQSGLSPEVARCIRRITDDLAQSPTIDELAALVGKSRSYVTRRFREETGLTISQFVTRERMRTAKRLLRYTSLPLSAISERLGYASQSYFCNVFKAETGTTPRRYRTATALWEEEEEV